MSEDRQGEGLALNLSIADNVTLTRFSSCSRWGWIDLVRQRKCAQSLIETLSIKARSARQPVSTLSGGNQQKTAVARLSHQDADVLLLDEPTRGIDVGAKAEIQTIVKDLAEQGLAVLMISSELEEVIEGSDRVFVLREGHNVAEFSGKEINEEAVMSAMAHGKDNIAKELTT